MLLKNEQKTTMTEDGGNVGEIANVEWRTANKTMALKRTLSTQALSATSNLK